VIVVDASALLELLLDTSVAERIASRIFDPNESLHAPHLIDLEIAQVLRRYARDRTLSPSRSQQALHDHRALRLTRYSHELLLPRIWELRHRVTAYDAAYLALAELLDAPLSTRDARLARAGGHEAQIELV
jgi:predicted nucleic acid-binding protein